LSHTPDTGSQDFADFRSAICSKLITAEAASGATVPVMDWTILALLPAVIIAALALCASPLIPKI
jgi:hypothetical protein